MTHPSEGLIERLEGAEVGSRWEDATYPMAIVCADCGTGHLAGPVSRGDRGKCRMCGSKRLADRKPSPLKASEGNHE